MTRNTYKKLIRYAGWSVVVLLLLMVLLRIGLAPLSITGINHWFLEQGIESSIEDISFRLGDGQLTVSGLDARVEGVQVLGMGQLRLGWSWSSLLERRIVLNSITISGLKFDVERGPGERLVVAGVDLARLSTEGETLPASAESEPVEWSIVLQQLSLEHFESCYRALPQHDFCSKFQTLNWQGDIGLDLARLADPVLPLQVSGDFRLANLKIHDTRLERGLLGLDEFALQEVRVDSLDDIAIKSIALVALTLFDRPTDPEHASITRFKAIQLEQLQLAQMSHLDIGELNLQGHEALIVSLSSNHGTQ